MNRNCVRILTALLAVVVMALFAGCKDDSGEGSGAGTGGGVAEGPSVPRVPDNPPIVLTADSTPYTHSGEFRANADASEAFPEPAEGSCVGQIPADGSGYPAPNYILNVQGNLRVQLDVTSETDTTLAVAGATEGTPVYCNDDGPNDTNPQLVLDLTAGAYRVFIGTYGEGEGSTSYQLTATVLPPEPTQPETPPTTPPGPEGTGAAPAPGPATPPTTPPANQPANPPANP